MEESHMEIHAPPQIADKGKNAATVASEFARIG